MSSVFHGADVFYGSRVSSNFYDTLPVRKPEPQTRGKHPILTDAQILELRALDQFAGWGIARLMARYSVNKPTVTRILSGVTRSRLIATRQHLPANLENL
uniref:Uncharacterized protein n=1 Tax=Pseudomonas phage Touem01 TaxID=3138548 RepID=A0AAU6W2J0_9VIRU